MSRIRLSWSGPCSLGASRWWIATVRDPVWLEVVQYAPNIWHWTLGWPGGTVASTTMHGSRLAAVRDAMRCYRAHPVSMPAEPAAWDRSRLGRRSEYDL